MSIPKRLYRVFFTSQGKGYELYARRVEQSELGGFVEVAELVFGERSSIVVDPSEDALRKEFSGVKKLLLPFHAVVRIDEVEKEGPAKVLALTGSQEGAAMTISPPGPPKKG